MKPSLSILLAAVLCVTVCASPLHRRPPRRIRRAPRIRLRCPSWQTIVASGAAAGTVITAYKLSNGAEEGMKTVAKEHPEEFSASLSVLTWPLRWGLLILMIASGWWLWRKFVGKINQRKESHNEDRSVEK